MEEKQNPKSNKPIFDRVLGDFGATSITLGAIIGSGIFFIIGFATAEAGSGVIISLLLAGIIAALTSLSFASLGSKIPKQGGEYQFVYLAFGPAIGFIAGLFWICSTAIAGVTVSIAFASYLTVFFPHLPINLTASVACIVFMLIDAIGLKLSAKVNNVLVAIKVGILILFILIGLPAIKISNFDNLFSKGYDGIFAAAFLIFFAYAGFGKITAAAEEVKDPQKTIPRAIIAGVTISTILYICAAVVSIGAVGPDKLSSSEFRNAPFSQVMRSLNFPGAFLLISVGALTATASVLLIQMFGLSRTVYGMASNNQLPSFLSQLHPTFKTPYKAQAILAVLMAIVAFFITTKSVITLTSLGILTYYAVINLSALILKKQEAGTFNVHPLIPILGFLSSASLIIYSIITGF